MNNFVNPPLDELSHHGIKGMHWGVRKSQSSGTTGTSNRKRNAKRAAVGVLAVGGAAAATYLLATHGHTPINSGISSKAGAKSVTALSNTAWKTKVSSLSSDIASANASQDVWMRSIGLGKVVNNSR